MMKQMILLLITVILVSCGSEPDVPPSIKSSFEQNYPTAEEVKWDKEDEFYKVEFEINKDEYKALYSTTGGVWIETTQEITREALPMQVQQVLQSEMYNGWEIDDVYKAETTDNPEMYKLKVKMGDSEEFHYFDSSGNLIKKS